MMPDTDRGSKEIVLRETMLRRTLVALFVVFLVFVLRTLLSRSAVATVAILVPLAVVSWIVFSREQWWFLLPVACSFGGLFYFGFRIYAHELALMLIVAALIPRLAVTKGAQQKRPPLPFAVWLLLFYLGAHLLVSQYANVADGQGLSGNTLRVYVRGLWPLIFFVLIYKYGSTKRLNYLLAAMYVACLLRVGLGLAGYYAPRFLYIPVINFVLPAVHTGGAELRASALLLASLALSQVGLAKQRVPVIAHYLIVALAAWLVFLGGSRGSLLAFFLIVILWGFLQRRFVMFGMAGAAILALIVTLNANSDIVYRFPPRMQRTLTVLLRSTSDMEIHKMVSGSDRWHLMLMRLGRERWLTSPRTFFLGNRVYPFDESSFRGRSVSMPVRTEVAASIGSYESGLWTVLAVAGLVGALLYVAAFARLIRGMIGELARRGLCDHTHAFYFLGVAGILSWLLLSPIMGGFPSHEIMLAGIAKAAFEDARAAAARKSEPEESAGYPDGKSEMPA